MIFESNRILVSFLEPSKMGWKRESFKLAIYLAIPLVTLTMSNWPSIVDYYQNTYRLDVYERTGVRQSVELFFMRPSSFA